MKDTLAVILFVCLCIFLIKLNLEQEVEVEICTHEGVLSYIGRTIDTIPKEIEGKLGECETKKMPNGEFIRAHRIWKRGPR